MRLRYALVVLLSLAALTGSDYSWAMEPQEAKARFRSGSSGSPVTAAFGYWIHDSKGASRLLIAGGHSTGSETWFIAEWQSPFTQRTRHPVFKTRHRFDGLGDPSSDLRLTERYRYRSRGTAWTPWLTVRKALGGGEVTTEGSLEHDVAMPARRWQFQWRLSGRVSTVGSFDGKVQITLQN